MNKLYTLEQLANFCEKHQLFSFSSNKFGHKLAAFIDGDLSFDKDEKGMLYVVMKACHIDRNRNGSYISKEKMEERMKTLKYRPVLGAIHELNDGTLDFHGHDMEFVKDKDGNEKVVYHEKQVGTFTADEPYLLYDKKNDKTYVMAYAAIPEEYTEAANIIRRKGGTKVSCELIIDEMHYNAKEKYLELDDFYFGGVTLLGSEKNGDEIGEGMLGSRADIYAFDEKEDGGKEYSLIDIDVNNPVDFNIDESLEKGGTMEMELDDKTLVTESNEDDATEPMVKESEENEDENVESAIVDKNDEENINVNSNEGNDDESKEDFSEKVLDKTISFKISHDDIRFSLYNLIAPLEEEYNGYFFICKIFNDNTFVINDYINDCYYGCKYNVDGDNVSLVGSLYKLYNEFLNQEEYDSLNEMRNNYSVVCNELESMKEECAKVSNELNEYKEKELNEQRNVVLNDVVYSEFMETDEFKELCENKSLYSVEELKDKADLLLGRLTKKNFSINKEGKKSTRFGFRKTDEDKEESKPKNSYGNIFDVD